MNAKHKLLLPIFAFLAMLVVLAFAGSYLLHREQRIHVTHTLQHGKPFAADFTYSPSFILFKPDKLTAISVSIGAHTEVMPTAAFSDLPPLDLKRTPVVGERFEVTELTVWPRPGTSTATRISWRFQNDGLSERIIYTPHGNNTTHYTKPPTLLYFSRQQGLAKATQQ